MLPILLREEQIARQMSSRIYSRALELYRKGAVENLVLRGRRLNAQVQGFHEPFYTVTIDFDEQGVRQATCTCAYDYGDWCKHIGAVLLACIRAPEKIVQMPPIEQVLEPLDAAALRRVLLELASEDPKVADRITLICASGTVSCVRWTRWGTQRRRFRWHTTRCANRTSGGAAIPTTLKPTCGRRLESGSLPAPPRGAKTPSRWRR